MRQITQTSVESVRSILQSNDKRHTKLDHLAYSYLATSSISTFVDKRKKEVKDEFWNALPKKAQSIILRLEEVAQSGITSKREVYTSSYFSCDVTARIGQEYVDMENLRILLGVSEHRFAKAVVSATKRRPPALILGVTER